MAFDAFMKIDGIPGESTDDKHKDWIEILSYSSGVSQHSGSASRSDAGAAAGGRAEFQDFSITKKIDKASPKLFLFCANGKHIKDVTFELCRATGDKQKYMEYKLSDVIVSSARPSGSPQGGEEVPVEEVSLNWGKLEITYTETDHKTGKTKGDVKSHWDTVANKGG
jgi:type VI secretion system secreted protein Hcp